MSDETKEAERRGAPMKTDPIFNNHKASVLACLMAQPERNLSVDDIARIFGLVRYRAAAIARALKADGVVTVSRDPHDRRVHRVCGREKA